MSLAEQAILREAPPIVDAIEPEMEAAVRDHSRLVYRIAFSVLRNHHDAEDATQETFLRLLRHRKRQPFAALRDPRAWLARAAWSAAIDRRRRTGPEITLEETTGTICELRAAGASAEEIAAKQEMAALLARLIASLPAGLRDVLSLSLVDELSSPEIAEILRIPEGSVRGRLLRARQVLKEKLTSLLERKHGREGTGPVR